MNLKIVLGIALPAFIIILLTVLSSLSIGFAADRTYVSSLTFDDIFTVDGTLKSQIEVGEVRLSNEYFLPKRYNLPATFVCLIDDEGNKETIDAGYISYSEGDATYNDPYSYNYYYQRRDGASVEIGTNDVKKVKIFLNPENLYVYQYEYGSNQTQQELILEKYGDYDSVALIEQDNVPGNYASCYSLSRNELNAGKKISLR